MMGYHNDQVVTGNGKRAGETDICLKMRNKDEY